MKFFYQLFKIAPVSYAIYLAVSLYVLIKNQEQTSLFFVPGFVVNQASVASFG